MGLQWHNYMYTLELVLNMHHSQAGESAALGMHRFMDSKNLIVHIHNKQSNISSAHKLNAHKLQSCIILKTGII